MDNKFIHSDLNELVKIPDNWYWKKLKYVAHIKFSSVDRHEYDDEIRVSICHYPDAYRNENIGLNTILSSGTCSIKEIESFSLKKGQVIITKDSETADDIGIPTFIEEDIPNSVCGYHLAIIESKDSELDTKFLFRYLQSSSVKTYFETNSNGVTRFGLGKSIIEDLFLPVPSKNEQIRITSYLEYQTGIIDNLISRKEKFLNLLKEYRTATIYEIITKGLNPNVRLKDSKIDWLGEIPIHWRNKRLKYVFKIKKIISGELGYEVLSVTQKGIKIRDTDNYKGQLSMDYSKYQVVEKGDFIMNHMDLLTGYVDISKWDGVTSPDYRVFSLNDENCLDRYFLYLFQFCYTNKIFYGLGQGVSQLGRWRLSSEQFNNFVLPYPSLEEQKSIVKYLDEVANTIDKISEKQIAIIERLKEYRHSLISEVVTGKIDVRDWHSNQLYSA